MPGRLSSVIPKWESRWPGFHVGATGGGPESKRRAAPSGATRREAVGAACAGQAAGDSISRTALFMRRAKATGNGMVRRQKASLRTWSSIAQVAQVPPAK